MTSNTSTSGKIIPPNLLLPLAIAGIAIVVISTALEYRSRKQDYQRLLENQATLFIETLTNTAQNAFVAAGEFEDEINNRLLSNLRLIEQFDQTETLTATKLKALLSVARFDEIRIYDKNDELIRVESSLSDSDVQIPNRSIAYLNEGKAGHLIIPSANHLAALVPRQRGGVIAGIVSAEQIQSFRQLFGFGNFLKRFQTGNAVEYIALQNAETIIAGIFTGYPLSYFSDDPFLRDALSSSDVQTRIVDYEHQTIFEAVMPFQFEGTPFGVLRLGLSMQEFDQLNSRARRRLVIFSGVLIVLGFILLSFVQAFRHRELLQKDMGHLQQYTNTILDNLGSSVLAIDENGLIQMVNKQGMLLLEQTFPDLIQKHYSTLPQSFQDIVATCLRNQSDTSPEQFWYSRHDQAMWLSVKASFLQQDEGQSLCILLVDDQTEQARLDEQIRRNEKLTAMRKLASTVAHEIRNPLNSIQMIIDLIKKKYQPEKGSTDYTKNLETVRGEISRITTIVDEFLRFSRPAPLKLAPIKYPILIDEIRSLYRERLVNSNIALHTSIAEHPQMMGDSEQLKQVFINLMDNAIDAIKSPGSIGIHGKVDGTHYIIQVEDSGAGIPKEDLDRVFDLYFTKKKNGSGIGLAVAHQIIENHRGTIEFNSCAGEGTTVVIRLPLQIASVT